ncbi:CASP8 and FADD-like apoptosis regulator isoform X1 [Cololabis saira]|uniref:CASP8 and FADD-like apoptosis regulator isoform X1 n=1 Tax=Cololabis saira TaxID=129043 RepID=UPI002AD20060|nr:CASP8 and FADD-like apoptosis regulator isoform X1 [Cololabis saira]XP_061580486.1 CASP8 and FADD-like apoptosis regulator isoform X1 [Cololabis saira]XP_061580487.1 CASP8 and FADD-like apoptosis regulator isoform X1 [Cololabis saira]
MACVDHLLREINQITECLGSGDCRKVLFLCETLETDNSVNRVKEILSSKVQCHENASLFLCELVWRVGRMDILRKLYKVSGRELEQTLKHREVLPRYRVLMANISEDIVKDDLESIKFLLSNTLSREKIKNAMSFLDVLIELEKLDSVSPERVDFVEKCLKDIGRIDLAKQVTAYRSSVETCEQRSSQQQSRFTAELQPIQPQRAAPRINAPLRVNRELSRQSTIEQYNFNTNPRGLCVIIDCVGCDGGRLEQTFKALHFNVVLHQWLSASDVLSVLTGISRQRDTHRGDGFVCCIISRGTTDHLLGTDSYGTEIPTDSVRHLFTGDSCPMLVGKPKLFFIQRYSVPEFAPYPRMDQRDEDLETDGCSGLAACNYIPKDADVFWSHCWTDESQLEQGEHHSVYLKALNDALCKAQRRRTNLVDVHTEVNGAIFEHNRRNPRAVYHIELKHTLRKDLYLE